MDEFHHLTPQTLRSIAEDVARDMRQRCAEAARQATVDDEPVSLTAQRAAIVSAIRTVPLTAVLSTHKGPSAPQEKENP